MIFRWNFRINNCCRTFESISFSPDLPTLDFGDQANEYWVLVNLFGELHGVIHAFKKDVASKDAERPGFPIESLAHYFQIYCGKELKCEHFRCKDMEELLEK